MARSALDHAKVVLGAILSNPPVKAKALLDKAIINLTDSHFPDLHHKNLFLLLERYMEVAGGVITRQALEDSLTRQNVDVGKKSLYLETYDALANSEVTEDDFKWSMDQLRELAAERATSEAITSGMEILTRGAKDSKGEDLFGHKDARSQIMSKFAEIDRELAMQESPEGDARTEAKEIWEEINNPASIEGIRFGIPDLDRVLIGNQNGELNLIAGFTNSGKSMLASAQLPWTAAIEQGKNVVILTTETLRPQIRRRLLARHSRHPMFNLEKGINSNDLKKGADFMQTYRADQYRILPDIINDFTNNPNYGKLVIVQVPRNATITSCEYRVLRYQREFDVDLVVIDSINLLRADRRFQSKREELASMLIEAKQFATTFADGRGVPVISPWQTSREAWKEAQEKGYYNTTGLSETHEASASADNIITILEPMNNNSREAQMKLQIAKSRDGETVSALDISVDYATAYWTSGNRVQDSNPMNSLLMGSGTSLFGSI